MNNKIEIYKDKILYKKIFYSELKKYCQNFISSPSDGYSLFEPYFDDFMKQEGISIVLPFDFLQTKIKLDGNCYYEENSKSTYFSLADDNTLGLNDKRENILNGVITKNNEIISLKNLDEHFKACRLYLHYLFMESEDIYNLYLKYLNFYSNSSGLPLEEDFAIKFLDFAIFTKTSGYCIANGEYKNPTQKQTIEQLCKDSMMEKIPLTLDKSEKHLRVKVLTAYDQILKK